MGLFNRVNEENKRHIFLLFGLVMLLVAVLGLLVATNSQTKSYPPSVSFDMEQNDQSVTITHAGGQIIPEDELFVQVGNSSIAWRHIDSDNDTRVSSGDSVVLSVRQQDNVTIVWRTPPDGTGLETVLYNEQVD
jgi:hypothetical protein